MTHSDYDALSSSWQRDEAERAQDAAMDDSRRCTKCGVDMVGGVIWPNVYYYCPTCGEFDEPSYKLMEIVANERRYQMQDDDDELEDATWEDDLP